MEPTWVLPAPDGPHVGPRNLGIRDQMVTPILLNIGLENGLLPDGTEPLLK